MFDRQGFLYVLQHAGLSKSEAGVVYGVTRQTIYNWLDGGEPTQPFVVRHAEVTTNGLISAIGAQLLPFPPSLDMQHRKKRLNTIVQQLHVLAKPVPLEVR